MVWGCLSDPHGKVTWYGVPPKKPLTRSITLNKKAKRNIYRIHYSITQVNIKKLQISC